ncbi:MAG: hypothetical protein ABH828_02865 [archaeon]
MLETVIGYLQHNSNKIISRLMDLFILPFENKEMTWVIVPVVLTILIMQFYFFKNRNEELGWNTAIANSLVLMFIAADLFRFLYNKNLLSLSNPGSNDFSLTVLVSIVLVEGLLMFFMDFSHVWPKFMAFRFSSHLTINLMAYTAIVLVYGDIPINMFTIIAAIIFFILVNMFFFIPRILFHSKY